MSMILFNLVEKVMEGTSTLNYVTAKLEMKIANIFIQYKNMLI